MSPQELAILHDASRSSSLVLSEGHERDTGPITDPSDPSVPESIKVFFEGEWCRWGDLMLADRKAYLMGDSYPY